MLYTWNYCNIANQLYFIFFLIIFDGYAKKKKNLNSLESIPYLADAKVSFLITMPKGKLKSSSGIFEY